MHLPGGGFFGLILPLGLQDWALLALEIVIKRRRETIRVLKKLEEVRFFIFPFFLSFVLMDSSFDGLVYKYICSMWDWNLQWKRNKYQYSKNGI